MMHLNGKLDWLKKRSKSNTRFTVFMQLWSEREPESYCDHLRESSLVSPSSWNRIHISCTIPLWGRAVKCVTVISFNHGLTDLTLRAIEAAGTGTDVGLNAGSPVQTDGVTQSCGRHKEPHLDSTDFIFVFKYSIYIYIFKQYMAEKSLYGLLFKVM